MGRGAWLRQGLHRFGISSAITSIYFCGLEGETFCRRTIPPR